jgi:hypothetical protein
MSEKAQEQASDDPAPTKESDANRVTQDEAEQASTGRDESPDEEAPQPDDQ